jgi:hypothetical protein
LKIGSDTVLLGQGCLTFQGAVTDTCGEVVEWWSGEWQGNRKIERNAFHFYFAHRFHEQLSGTEPKAPSSEAIP